MNRASSSVFLLHFSTPSTSKEEEEAFFLFSFALSLSFSFSAIVYLLPFLVLERKERRALVAAAKRKPEAKAEAGASF